MKNLTLYPVDTGDHLVRPDEFDDITLESPALALLTDFKSHRPHVVETHTFAAEAAERMLCENIYLKLVVDREGELVGLVSYDELSDQNILLRQVTTRVMRNDVVVADVMLPRKMIQAISYEDFKRATVADIITLLQRNGQQHYIVVDRDQHHIRGVVSSKEIARRLHTAITIEQKPSVADMASVILRE